MRRNPFPGELESLFKPISLHNQGENNGEQLYNRSSVLEGKIGELLKKTKKLCQYTREVAQPLRANIHSELQRYKTFLELKDSDRSFYHVKKIDDSRTTQFSYRGLLTLMSDIVDQEQLLELLKRTRSTNITNSEEYRSEEESLDQMIDRVKKLNQRLNELRLRKSERVHYLSS